MKRILIALVAAAALFSVSAPAQAAYPYRYGVRVYAGYPGYYGPYYRPYGAYYRPRVYYPPAPVVPVYPAPAPAPFVGGYYATPGFGFYFGR